MDSSPQSLANQQSVIRTHKSANEASVNLDRSAAARLLSSTAGLDCTMLNVKEGVLGSSTLPSSLVNTLNLMQQIPTSCSACVFNPIIGNIPCSNHLEQIKEAALSRYDILSSQLQLGLLASGYPVLPISRDFSLTDNGRKKKKTRTTFSRAQVFGLERKFATQKYLSTHDRILLAAALQMTECQVKIWFQNRRTKWRREKAMMKQGNRNNLLMSCDSDHMIQ
ncbi:hypothetical protein ACHWQZ_G013920 [Mnemiopsis leidyi]